jgi:hypothetical protein
MGDRTGAAAVLLAGLLAACGGMSKEERAAADANAAGFVPPSVTSRLDFGGQQERRFRRLDADANDIIDPNEVPDRFRDRVMRFDSNKDGRVSLAEFSDGSLAHFDAIDLNKDGTVTSEEMQTSGKRL